MNEYASWLVLLVMAILLIIIGFQGSLGKILACIVTPSQVEWNTNG